MSDNTTENDPLILTGCACYCILRGDPLNQVTAILIKATNVEPDCEIAWLTLAYSYILASEYDQSLATLRNVDRRFPNSISVPAFEASLHLKSGSLSLAWPWIKRACDITPNSPFILHEKGVAYLLDGDFSSAAQLFQNVLKNTEEHDIVVAAQINLGHCYRKMKNYDDAIEIYQAAISNDNNSANALSSIVFTDCGILIVTTPIEPVDSPLPKKPPDFLRNSRRSSLSLQHILLTSLGSISLLI